MDSKDEVKQRLDIVDLIGEYIQLKPAGSGNMKAVCPFHREKTPSFYVSKEKQIWHCFGCGKGGDAFAFVMEMEGVEFPEALQQLAEKTGVEIKRFSSEGVNEKTRLFDLLELSTKFYQRCLSDSEAAQVARDYLKKREISDESVMKFRLGYSLDRWDTLVTFLKKRGYREQEIINAGLALRRQDGSGLYDRFRHRLMFPITDVRGKVVGYSGRQLDETREGGKYINTPQTTVYNKSEVLYGLSLAKKAIKDSGAVVVVEGNTDVIASHKGGVEAVVASSGTAFTEEQLALLKRFTDTILMCFDADPAGESAAKRGIDLALEVGMNVKVIQMPEGVKDPDELVKKDPAAWKRAIADATDVMTYYFSKTFRASPKSATEKKKVGDILLPEIARLQSPIERSHWLRELSVRLGTPENILEETMAKMKKKKTENRESRIESQLASQPIDRATKLSEAFLALLFARHDFRDQLMEALAPEYLVNPHRDLYLSFVSEYHVHADDQAATDGDRSRFFATFREKIQLEKSDLVPLFDRLAMHGDRWYRDRNQKDVQVEVEGVVAALRENVARQERGMIADELREAEARDDQEKIEELMKKFNELI